MELLYFGSKGWGDELFAAFLMTIAVSITAMLIGILFSIILLIIHLQIVKFMDLIRQKFLEMQFNKYIEGSSKPAKL